MFTRILIASATVVALAAPPAYAGSPHFLFGSCGSFFFAPQGQCAIQFAKGNGNKAKTLQDMTLLGHQFALTIQKGDNNNSYTSQSGTDEVAVTVQKGNGNSASTQQDGTNLTAVTVQTGSNGWSVIGMAGDGGVATVTQSN